MHQGLKTRRMMWCIMIRGESTDGFPPVGGGSVQYSVKCSTTVDQLAAHSSCLKHIIRRAGVKKIGNDKLELPDGC